MIEKRTGKWVTVTRTISIPVSVSCREDQIKTMKDMPSVDFYLLYALNIETMPSRMEDEDSGVTEIGEAKVEFHENV